MSYPFTPWARSAIRGAGLDPDEIRARVPDGWYIGGSATSARGPWGFSLVGPESQTFTVMAYRLPEVPEAIERLFAKVEQ